jgi:hypothetical protein
LSIVAKERYDSGMRVRFEHRRRPKFFSLLRKCATGFLVFGAVALACGIYVAKWSPLLLAGSMVGVGFGVAFLWFLKRTQRLYEGAYLEFDEDGLVVGGEGGVRALTWAEVESAEVIRLGSRLRFLGRDGSVLVFPFSESMRRLGDTGDGTTAPKDVIVLIGEHTEMRGNGEDGGQGTGEWDGIWRILDWLLFCLAGFLLLMHMLAAMLMVAPGSRLAQAGLSCIALMGVLLAIRGLAFGRAVTAVGVFCGSAARIMGWFGAGGAAAAVLLFFVV